MSFSSGSVNTHTQKKCTNNVKTLDAFCFAATINYAACYIWLPEQHKRLCSCINTLWPTNTPSCSVIPKVTSPVLSKALISSMIFLEGVITSNEFMNVPTGCCG